MSLSRSERRCTPTRAPTRTARRTSCGRWFGTRSSAASRAAASTTMPDAGAALASWAKAHGLQSDTGSQATLPELTPLLRRGDTTEVAARAEGVLPGGIDGELAQFNQVDHDDDGPDRRTPFTVVLVAIPEIVAFVPSLSCRPKGSEGPEIDFPGIGDGEVDSTYKPDRKVDLESVELDRLFDVRIDPEVGDNWVLQLFSPAFIAWLCDERHRDVRFELDQGALCVYRPSHLDDPAQLDSLCEEAAAVAKRIRDEALEEEGLIEAGRSALPTRKADSRDAWIESNVRKVEWPEPPPDVATPISAYRLLAMRHWRAWAYGIGVLIGGWLIAALLLAGGDGRGAAFLLLTPVAAGGIFWSMVSDRARAFAKWAFAGGYAKTRHLQLENPRLFQARNMRLGFPGVVETAFAGGVTPDGGPGHLAFSFTGRSGNRKDFNVLVVPLAAEDAGSLPPEPENGAADWAVHGGSLAVWLPSFGDAKRTAAGIDDFRRVASERVAALRSGSA